MDSVVTGFGFDEVCMFDRSLVEAFHGSEVGTLADPFLAANSNDLWMLFEVLVGRKKFLGGALFDAESRNFIYKGPILDRSSEGLGLSYPSILKMDNHWLLLPEISNRTSSEAVLDYYKTSKESFPFGWEHAGNLGIKSRAVTDRQLLVDPQNSALAYLLWSEGNSISHRLFLAPAVCDLESGKLTIEVSKKELLATHGGGFLSEVYRMLHWIADQLHYGRFRRGPSVLKFLSRLVCSLVLTRLKIGSARPAGQIEFSNAHDVICVQSVESTKGEWDVRQAYGQSVGFHRVHFKPSECLVERESIGQFSSQDLKRMLRVSETVLPSRVHHVSIIGQPNSFAFACDGWDPLARRWNIYYSVPRDPKN